MTAPRKPDGQKPNQAQDLITPPPTPPVFQETTGTAWYEIKRAAILGAIDDINSQYLRKTTRMHPDRAAFAKAATQAKDMLLVPSADLDKAYEVLRDAGSKKGIGGKETYTERVKEIKSEAFDKMSKQIKESNDLDFIMDNLGAMASDPMMQQKPLRPEYETLHQEAITRIADNFTHETDRLYANLSVNDFNSKAFAQNEHVEKLQKRMEHITHLISQSCCKTNIDEFAASYANWIEIAHTLLVRNHDTQSALSITIPLLTLNPLVKRVAEIKFPENVRDKIDALSEFSNPQKYYENARNRRKVDPVSSCSLEPIIPFVTTQWETAGGKNVYQMTDPIKNYLIAVKEESHAALSNPIDLNKKTYINQPHANADYLYDFTIQAMDKENPRVDPKNRFSERKHKRVSFNKDILFHNVDHQDALSPLHEARVKRVMDNNMQAVDLFFNQPKPEWHEFKIISEVMRQMNAAYSLINAYPALTTKSDKSVAIDPYTEFQNKIPNRMSELNVFVDNSMSSLSKLVQDIQKGNNINTQFLDFKGISLKETFSTLVDIVHADATSKLKVQLDTISKNIQDAFKNSYANLNALSKDSTSYDQAVLQVSMLRNLMQQVGVPDDLREKAKKFDNLMARRMESVQKKAMEGQALTASAKMDMTLTEVSKSDAVSIPSKLPDSVLKTPLETRTAAPVKQKIKPVVLEISKDVEEVPIATLSDDVIADAMRLPQAEDEGLKAVEEEETDLVSSTTTHSFDEDIEDELSNVIIATPMVPSRQNAVDGPRDVLRADTVSSASPAVPHGRPLLYSPGGPSPLLPNVQIVDRPVPVPPRVDVGPSPLPDAPPLPPQPRPSVSSAIAASPQSRDPAAILPAAPPARPEAPAPVVPRFQDSWSDAKHKADTTLHFKKSTHPGKGMASISSIDHRDELLSDKAKFKIKPNQPERTMARAEMTKTWVENAVIALMSDPRNKVESKININVNLNRETKHLAPLICAYCNLCGDRFNPAKIKLSGVEYDPAKDKNYKLAEKAIAKMLHFDGLGLTLSASPAGGPPPAPGDHRPHM